MPKRIQMSRKKGWRKPEGVVYCGRPSKWGSPFDWRLWQSRGREWAVSLFRNALFNDIPDAQKPHQRNCILTRENRAHMDRIRRDIEELRDKDLGCWCALTDPCHVDVLLELANRPKEIAKG